MSVRNRLALSIAGSAAASVAQAQSLTTSFTGTTQSIGNGAGTFFDVTALHENGIIVNSFDVNLGASAGSAVPVHFYYRPGTHVGVEQDMTEWRYLGHTIATSAGTGNPTPVAIGGVHIRENETIGFRFGNGSSNQRYNSEATTLPEHANDDVRINLGAAQNSSFFSAPFAPRGWNGTIYYTIGASVSDGACCRPDGTCMDGRIEACQIAGGIYQGDGTACATVPGGCPAPAPGACCLAGGTCILEFAATCRGMNGIYNGDETTCDAAACGQLDAFTTTITITTGQYAGNFFNVHASGGLDVEITGWDLNVSSSLGTQTSIRVYYRPGPWEGFHADPGAWLLVDEIPVVAAGPGNPTRIDMRGPIIPAGEVYGFRIGPSVGALRYTSEFPIVVSTDHIELIRGAAQGVLFGTSLLANRGWQGIIHYRALGTPKECYANCDGSTGEPLLTVDDFTCFINEFASAQGLPHEQQVAHYANCDGSTTAPALTVDDFTCFINAFAQGCP